jgi:hypothetical protein
MAMKYVHDQHNALRGRRIGNAHPRVATTVWSWRRLEVELPITHNAVHFLGGYA